MRIPKFSNSIQKRSGDKEHPAQKVLSEAPKETYSQGELDSPQSMMRDLSRLARKAIPKAALGLGVTAAAGAGLAALGGAGPIVGGIAGLIVGAVAAPANALIGAFAGGLAGVTVGLSKGDGPSSLFKGFALGALGTVVGGVAGFYGSAALAGMAGLATSPAGLAAGAAALAPVGASLGQVFGMASEYGANSASYPALAHTLSQASKPVQGEDS